MYCVCVYTGGDSLCIVSVSTPGGDSLCIVSVSTPGGDSLCVSDYTRR